VIDYSILACSSDPACADEMVDSPENSSGLPLLNSFAENDVAVFEQDNIEFVDLPATIEGVSDEVNNAPSYSEGEIQPIVTDEPLIEDGGTEENIIENNPELIIENEEETLEGDVTGAEAEETAPDDLPAETIEPNDGIIDEPITAAADAILSNQELLPPVQDDTTSDSQPIDQVITESPPAIEQKPVTVSEDVGVVPDTGGDNGGEV
jgi:hypothetical protein